MGMPRKPILESRTTFRQAVGVSGGGGIGGGLVLILEALGVDLPPEVVAFLVWAGSALIGPILSRLIAAQREAVRR